MRDGSAWSAAGTAPSTGTATNPRRAEFVHAEAGNSAYQSEMATLLRRRLQIMAAIGAFVELASTIRTAVIMPGDTARGGYLIGMLIVGTVMAVLALLFLSLRKSAELATLRRLELILVFIYFTTVFSWVMGWANGGRVIPIASPPELKTFFPQHVWGVYPDHRFVMFDPVYSIGSVFVINWGLLIMGYSVLIPNTWRRCLLLLSLMVIGAVASVFAGAYLNPALLHHRFRIIVAITPFIVAFAAIGLYGSHKLATLGKQAFTAKQVGQYVLKQQIGKGGMGEVFLAQHRLLRRPCAVKLIRSKEAGSSSSLARFEREVQAMARLTHPNTVEIYDYGRTRDGTFYYAMEYLPGLTSEDLVRRHGCLPAERVVYLLLQVCRALREAHHAGLIHRDIKPGNLFVSERGGEFDVMKLLDFGLVGVAGDADPQPTAEDGSAEDPPGGEPADLAADVVIESHDSVRLTQAGHILGTPAYLSPEQAAGRDVDARSDIYSLGAVGYYLLSGRPPFLRSSPAQMYKAHLHEQPTPISTYVPAIPADLASILHRCLEKDPAQRFADIRELETALLSTSCAQAWDSEKAARWWTAARKSPSLPTIPSEPDHNSISMMHTIDATSHPSPA